MWQGVLLLEDGKGLRDVLEGEKRHMRLIHEESKQPLHVQRTGEEEEGSHRVLCWGR